MNQAETMTKPGLRNSEGWNEAKPSEIQRTAPLPKSVPITGRAIRVRKANAKPTTPMRRTCCGLIIEIATITTRPTPPNSA